MGKIIVNVTDRKGTKHTIEGQQGQTLMQLIDQHELANPYGICGGEPMCGTCHVYVEKEWLNKLNQKTSEEEDAMGNASESSEVDILVKYMKDNIDKRSGIHLTGGAQVKLLMVNAFVNARYTLAKDVIPDKMGFLSIWAGAGIGF